MKVALVHDDFCQKGGAENLFAQIAKIYPDAPIYTALVDWNKLPVPISQNRVRPSFMQKIPFAPKIFKLLLPLYPLAFESFDFSKFDLVISSTTRFAKGIITKPSTLHICYINSTPRFLWHPTAKSHYYPGWISPLVNPIFSWLKRWDKASAARPDYLIGNSQNVKEYIRKIYKRDADVVYPFADTEFFTPAELPVIPSTPTVIPSKEGIPKKENQILDQVENDNTKKSQKDYYLIVSRLVKWKRVDLAVKACAKLGVNLKIVGTGPDKNRLSQISSSVIPSTPTVIPSKEGIPKKENQILDQVENDSDGSSRQARTEKGSITFLGSVSRETLRGLYQNARALIVTQEEDFGITIAEANACGIPVIAYDHGGQKEIIANGETGLFFKEQSQKSLEDAILASSKVKWDVSACRKNSLRFKKAIFVKDFQNAITDKIKESRIL